MPSKAVSDAVEAQIGTTWTSIDGTPLQVLGLNSSGQGPASGSPHIIVTYPVANERQFSIGAPGSNDWAEDGAFRIIVNAARGQGTSIPLGWCDELRALFRGKTLSDTVQCHEAGPPVMNDANDLGNYYQFSFAVVYRYYITG